MNNTPIRPDQPFVFSLLENQAYTSPAPRRPALFAPLRYLAGIFKIAFSCGWTARHHHFDNQDAFNRSYDSVKLVEAIGGTVEIRGLEHLAAPKGPVVVVANHMSLLETFMIPCILIPFRPVCIVLKKELTEYPGFGRAMKALNHIAVSRDNPRADFRTVMEEGVAFLNNGISVILFPQSTRNATFIPAEFNTLGVKLAAKAGVPVVPVALKTDLHGNGRVCKEFGRIDPSRPVRFRFGPPVDPQKEGRQAHDRVVRFIADQLRNWGLPVRESAAPTGQPTP